VTVTRTRLVLALIRGVIHVWSASDHGVELVRVIDDRRSIHAFIADPDGRYVATWQEREFSGKREHSVAVRDVSSGRIVAERSIDERRLGAFVWAPQSKIVHVSHDGVMREWRFLE
jgi:hypothetical protein